MNLIFQMRISHSWRGRDFGLILLVLSLNARITSIGSCVNDRGECCTNFYHYNGTCIPCPPGSYGDNCSTTCSPPHYGISCAQKCVCSADEECNPYKGCVRITTATTPLTRIKTGNDMESIQNSMKVETKSAGNPNSSKVDKVHPVDLDSIPISAMVSKETYSVTPKPASGGDSQTLQVIIITGSVLSLFLIIIIINQIHGKLKTRMKNISASQISNPVTTNEAEEVGYVEINESGMLDNISRYGKIESQPSTQQKTHEDVSKIEICDVTKPMLPKLRNRMIDIKSEESTVRQVDQSLEERRSSDYLDVVTDKVNESPDNSYLKPVGMKNTYIELIGSPPKGMLESGSRADCQTSDVESPSTCPSETSQRGTYLEVVHQ